MEIGHDIGLVDDVAYDRLVTKKSTIEREVARLKGMRPRVTETIRIRTKNTYLENMSSSQTVAEILRRQESRYGDLLSVLEMNPLEDREIADEVELEIKYEGYIQRQVQQIRKFRKFEQRHIPAWLDYDEIPGFSREVREKFKRVRPETIGQASRISGVTPPAISLLLVTIEKRLRQSSGGLPERRGK
jgi:tRNA uridine 5-carboxymethylaminomethyl modification enzyme